MILLSYNLYLFIPVFIYTFIEAFIYLYIYLSIYLFILVFIHAFIYVYLSHFMSSLRLAAAERFSLTIPETLFYSKALQGAAALISRFPNGISVKVKVNNLLEASKWKIMLFRFRQQQRVSNQMLQSYRAQGHRVTEEESVYGI